MVAIDEAQNIPSGVLAETPGMVAALDSPRPLQIVLAGRR
jgi:hypothetical protein